MAGVSVRVRPRTPCEVTVAAYLWRMRFLPLSLLLAFAAASPASAQSMTAGALQAMCSARTQQATCASYIQGYIDGRNQSSARATVCIPAGTSIGDVIGGFSDRLTKNRLEANLEAGLVVGDYLITSFPCR
jgi:hypothetical protein